MSEPNTDTLLQAFYRFEQEVEALGAKITQGVVVQRVPPAKFPEGAELHELCDKEYLFLRDTNIKVISDEC
jgi:hypothetical protein